MSVFLKCAACGYEVPFKDGDMSTEAICPGCEVMLRRRSMADLMAIPVSMALPDSFLPADLGRVPKHSRELIHRYKTGEQAVQDPRSESNVVLAKAIERLALALEGNGGNAPKPSVTDLTGLLASLSQQGVPDSAISSFLANMGTPGPSGEVATAPEDVLVLNGQTSGNGKSTAVDANGRALPVVAPVLVRREAAAEAHRYRRENQAATDIKGQRQSGVSEWVEKHPVVMMSAGLFFLIALVVMTTMVMSGMFERPVEDSAGNQMMIGDTNADGPDFNHAEREARGFLNAVNLNAAKPYIYQSSRITEKLEAFYQPLEDPGNYTLEFRSRQRNGDRAAYYYQVESGEKIQPIIVLQERENFKVFWEFGACVGDLSWSSFLESEPSRPVLMRAFLKPDDTYDPIHSAEDWSSWRAQDWDGSNSIRVYCKRGSPEDRRLNSALREFPVVRDSANWVMAQVTLKHLRSISGKGADLLESAEVFQVPLGSWLPKEFVGGNTFYSERDRVKNPGSDIFRELTQ